MFSDEINIFDSYCKSYLSIEKSKKTKNQIIIDEVKKLLQILKLQINSEEVDEKIKTLDDLLFKVE